MGVGEGHFCDTSGDGVGVAAQLYAVARRTTSTREETKARVGGMDRTTGRDRRVGEAVREGGEEGRERRQ